MKAKLIIDGVDNGCMDLYTGEDRVVKVTLDMPDIHGVWWWGKILDGSNFPRDLYVRSEKQSGSTVSLYYQIKGNAYRIYVGSKHQYIFEFNKSREMLADILARG
jgi:hypothetical protein